MLKKKTVGRSRWITPQSTPWMCQCSSAESSPGFDIHSISPRPIKLPTAWKEGNVVPVHKKGKRNIRGNYRPISPTSVIGKLMEALNSRCHIVHHMNNHLLWWSSWIRHWHFIYDPAHWRHGSVNDCIGSHRYMVSEVGCLLQSAWVVQCSLHYKCQFA